MTKIQIAAFEALTSRVQALSDEVASLRRAVDSRFVATPPAPVALTRGQIAIRAYYAQRAT